MEVRGYCSVTVGWAGGYHHGAPCYLEHPLLRGLQRFPLRRVHELVRKDVVQKLPILAHTNPGKGREETVWEKGDGYPSPLQSPNDILKNGKWLASSMGFSLFPQKTQSFSVNLSSKVSYTRKEGISIWPRSQIKRSPRFILSVWKELLFHLFGSFIVLHTVAPVFLEVWKCRDVILAFEDFTI